MDRSPLNMICTNDVRCCIRHACGEAGTCHLSVKAPHFGAQHLFSAVRKLWLLRFITRCERGSRPLRATTANEREDGGALLRFSWPLGASPDRISVRRQSYRPRLECCCIKAVMSRTEICSRIPARQSASKAPVPKEHFLLEACEPPPSPNAHGCSCCC